MSGLLDELLTTSMQALIGWLVFSFLASLLLGIACEPLRIPKRFRVLLVALLVPLAFAFVGVPWLLLPLIAVLSWLVGQLVSAMDSEDLILVGSREHGIDPSRIKGKLGEHYRAEIAAIRAAATKAAAETKASAEIEALAAQHGVVRVSARW